MRNGFSLWRLLRRIVILIILVVLVLPAGLTLLYREVAPPATPLMVIRLFEIFFWPSSPILWKRYCL